MTTPTFTPTETLTAAHNSSVCNNLIDSVLPSFGNSRIALPVWDESQKLFIGEEYESAAGNRYYRGIRFSDRIAIVEKIGLYHSWTYIDGLELYVFDNKAVKLAQKRSFKKVFHDAAFVRSQSEQMVSDYLRGTAKILGNKIADSDMTDCAKSLVDSCYKSFLENDYNIRLMQILPLIDSSND